VGIDWTTVLASSLTAAIISGVTFVTNRYLARALDRIERELKTDKEQARENRGRKTPARRPRG